MWLNMKAFARQNLYFTAILISLVVVMLILYSVPPQLQDKLVLNYQEFSFSNPADWIRLYTSHFVHQGFEHLVGNLLVFVMIFLLICILAASRSFKRLLIFVFIFLPPILALLDLVINRKCSDITEGYGFSGINMALTGVIPYFSAKSLKNRSNLSPIKFSCCVAIVVFGLVALIYTSLLFGVSLLLSGFVLLSYLFLKEAKRDWHNAAFLFAIFLLIFIFVSGAFPKILVTNEGIVNIIAHYFGFWLSSSLFPPIDGILFKD